MNNAILQVPINKNLRDQALTAAEKMGFSSLQEVVRLFLGKVARQEVNFNFEEAVQLSPGTEKRYMKITEDFKKGKNIFTARDIDEFLKQLDEN